MLGVPATGVGKPYVLRAEFTTRSSISGVVETGSYTDTWISDKRWRREAILKGSRFVRSRNGDKRYRLDEGPDAAVLQFVLTAMEPIPAYAIAGTEWETRRELLGNAPAVRVSKVQPRADSDPKQTEAYWFDGTGQLVQSSLNGLEVTRSNFQDFDGVSVARHLEVLAAGKVAMRIDVTALAEDSTANSKFFTLKGHEWVRPIMTEAR
jgi:hypothetical protein